MNTITVLTREALEAMYERLSAQYKTLNTEYDALQDQYFTATIEINRLNKLNTTLFGDNQELHEKINDALNNLALAGAELRNLRAWQITAFNEVDNNATQH